jgi:ABC-type transport system involved in cytochrome c biogenesis ATPase subunit
MFGKVKDDGDYSKLSLDDFSDDESHDGGGAAVGVNKSQQLMKKQDEGLEMLGQSAERLGKMSLQINEELGFQNQVLDGMENDLDDANDDLDLLTRKTQEFIEFTGGQQNCVLIVSLAAVAMILFFLILYT